MNNKNTIEDRLLSVMQESLRPEAGQADEIDYERIALLAEGRIDELAAGERAELLEHIASNPEAARLVKDLQEINRAEQQENKGASFWSSPRVFRNIAVSWAVAACMMIGLFIWNSMVPDNNAGSDGTITTLNNESDPDYWQQLNNKRMYENGQGKYLEYAFTASTTACFVLSAGLVICVLKRQQ